MLKGGTQAVVAPLHLRPLHSPLAAVIDARDARHTEQQGVDERQMLGIRQVTRDARDIVVIHKAQQVLALVEGPIFGAELAQQAVGDLKHIVAVEAGIQPLVALVVGAAVQHLVAHKLVVVSVQQLAHQKEFRLERITEGAQLAQEVAVEAVGHIEAQAVDIELLHPAPDAGEQVLLHRGVAQVELDQLVMTLPALVPQPVVIGAVAAEADLKPVFILRALPVAQHVLKRPKAAPHMVEHPVEHHADARAVQRFADGGKVLVGPQARVDLRVIAGVVPVPVGLKHRRKIDRIGPQPRDMPGPIRHPADTRRDDAVVFLRRAAQPQRINLIKYAFIGPHERSLPLSLDCLLLYRTSRPEAS